MQRDIALAVVLGLLLSCAWAAPAQAKNNNRAATTNKSNKNNNSPKAPDHAAVDRAQKDLSTATADAAKADGEVNTIALQLRKDFEASADYRAAAAALNEVQTAYETSRNRVLTALSPRADYAAAKAAKAKAEQERDALQSSGAAPEQLTPAAKAVLDAASVVSRLEADALAADPEAVAAKSKLVAAGAKVSQLNKEFEASIHNNAKWTAAKSTLDSARARIEKAKTDLKTAQDAYDKANRAYQDQLARNDQQNRNKNRNNKNNPNNNNGRLY